MGRLVTAKGLSHLILALKHVEKKDANVVLLLVGDGPLLLIDRSGKIRHTVEGLYVGPTLRMAVKRLLEEG